jgi:hypothetical protein
MMPSFSHSPAIRWPHRMSGCEAMIEEVRFAEDSPLEGTGFEPPLPPRTEWSLAGAATGNCLDLTFNWPRLSCRCPDWHRPAKPFRSIGTVVQSALPRGCRGCGLASATA